MGTQPQQELTAILGRARAGDERARGELIALVMTLRYFSQLTVPEVAAALGISPATVERDWRLARAWLRGELRGGDE
jgi:DNA-directed RNA polymerase specialized sigma subunit